MTKPILLIGGIGMLQHASIIQTLLLLLYMVKAQADVVADMTSLSQAAFLDSLNPAAIVNLVVSLMLTSVLLILI